MVLGTLGIHMKKTNPRSLSLTCTKIKDHNVRPETESNTGILEDTDICVRGCGSGGRGSA
jgi:hypothetical protein